MKHENAFWLNFMVDKIVRSPVVFICPLLNYIPILCHLTKNSMPYKLSGKTKFSMASCVLIFFFQKRNVYPPKIVMELKILHDLSQDLEVENNIHPNIQN